MINILHYPGLQHFWENLQKSFIWKPKNKVINGFLKLTANGPVWETLPGYLHYRGSVIDMDHLPGNISGIGTPAEGDVYTVGLDGTGDEYFYKIYPDDTEGWEPLGSSDFKYISGEADTTTAANNVKSVAVGGIANNTSLTNISDPENPRTVSEVLDMILFPDIQPQLSGSKDFTFTTSKSRTVQYGADVYDVQTDFSVNPSSQTINYSKLNNTGNVLTGQTYQGGFTYSISQVPANIAKFTENTTYKCTGTWANGDKYPCTKKGNTPSGSLTDPYISDSIEKTISINVYKHCLYGVADTINATSIAQGTKRFISEKPASNNRVSITLTNAPAGYHFIAVPAVQGQNWAIGEIEAGAFPVTNTFNKTTIQNVSVTNNGVRYTMDMYVAYLKIAATPVESITYNVQIV